jgi:hypothetical protein
MQDIAERQAMPSKSPGEKLPVEVPDGIGTGLIVHVLPLSCSEKNVIGLAMVCPMAMHAVELVHATP